MKIAVQFFGHLRTYEKCANSIKKHLLALYDCDVFMHTWSETDHHTQTWHKQDNVSSKVDGKAIEKLKFLYDLKDIVVEEQTETKNDTLIPCQHNHGKSLISKSGIGFMLYSKQKVNELRKKYQKRHNVKYDYVLMVRPDIKLNRDFILNAVDSEINTQQPRIARYCACSVHNSLDFPIIGDTASDIIYFARPEIIDKTIDILNKIDLEKHKNDMWNPESLFNQELESHGISSLFINYQGKTDWEIVRKSNKRNLRKSYIDLKIRKNLFYLHLLKILPISLFSLKLSISGVFLIDFCLGKNNYD